MPVNSSRKRQARLSFTPLPSSSPASKEYNDQIRDRAAAVTISPSPNKRRKLDSHPIPTPIASSAIVKNAIERLSSDDDLPTSSNAIRSASKKHRSKPRFQQQSLDFGNARDPSSFDTPIHLKSRNEVAPTQAGMFSSQGRRYIDISSSGDSASDSDDLPTPKGAPVPPLGAPIEERGEKGLKNKGKVTGLEQVESLTAQTVEEEDEDSDDVITSSHRDRRRKGRIATPRKPSARADVSEEGSSPLSSAPLADDSDDDVIVVPKAAKRKGSSEDIEESDGSEAEVSRPRRRRLKRPRQMSEQEQDDLAEDLDNIGPSSDIELATQSQRNSKASQKNARQQALEKLKRKRAGQCEIIEEEDKEEEVEENGRAGSLDSDDLLDDAMEDNMPFASSRSMFQEDADDAGFLAEDDDETTLGVPEGIPIQYTRYGTMKPKELFKFAVEWSVQKLVNPAFQRTDEIYNLTFSKLDTEVAGLAGSKFKSSAWTPEFTYALDARPDLAFERIDRHAAEHFMRDKCDACNRSSHPATYQIQFIGKPYNANSLEDITSNSDSGDSDPDETSSSSEDEMGRETRDAQGRTIAPEAKIFYVGKFCMANAQTAHTLRHWRYHLNEMVSTWLASHGYRSERRLAKREKWSTEKRFKYANKLVSRMEKDGEVKKLWHLFKTNIDAARYSKQGRFGDDSP